MNENNSTVLSEHKYDDALKVKNGKKKRIIRILSAVLAVAVLSGGVFFAKKLKTPEKDDETADNSVTLVNAEDETVKSVLIKSQKETIEIIAGKNEYAWSIKGVNASLTDSNEIGTLVSDALNISADAEIENPDGDSRYGLSSPYLKIKVTAKEKNDSGFSGYTLTVGGFTANKDGRYAKLDGKNSVYVISADTAEKFNVSKLSFASKSVVTAAEISEEEEKDEKLSKYFNSGLLQYFDECSASGGEMEYSLLIKRVKDTTYKMVKPYDREINPDSSVNFLSILKYGVTAEGVYSYGQSAADIEKYGLRDPIKIKITSADKYSAKLNIGKCSADGYYAVTASDRLPIYKVAADEFDFLFDDINTYFSKNIISDAVNEFSTVKISADGISAEFSFLKEDEKDTTPETKLDGKEIDFEQFRRLYKRFLAMSTVESVNGSEKGRDTVLTAVFQYNDEDTEQKTLTVKKYTARKYLVSINGKPTGVITKTDVTNLINSLKTVKSGRTLSDTDLS